MDTIGKTLKKIADEFHNPLTLVDIEAEDQPLVLVNRKFCELTGYDKDEILGRNCRFLQGPHTDKADVAYIRRSIEDNQAVYCDLLNYRKNETPFYNRLVLLPIKLGNRRHFLGMQIDSTEQVRLLQTKSHQDFDEFKTSEYIKDKIRNSLMKVQFVSDELDESDEHVGKQTLFKAFEDILTTVKEIPYNV